MASLNGFEKRVLRRLLKKVISGRNGGQVGLFSLLYELDQEVNYEDNEATRTHWYRKWFELGFSPAHKMGERTPRVGDKVFFTNKLNPLGRTYGEVTGISVTWEIGDRTSVSPSMIKVVD